MKVFFVLQLMCWLHALSIVSFLIDRSIIRKPFKFFNMWTTLDAYQQLLIEKWKFLGQGTAQFRLKQLLNGLKRPLQRLNLHHFSHISSRAASAKQELQSAQLLLLRDGIQCDDYHNKKKKVEILLEAERLFIAQKAKCRFLLQGDRCTKFFHDLIKRNNKRNAILNLKKSDGSFTSNAKEIGDEFKNFFSRLLGTSIDRAPFDTEAMSGGPVVSQDDWAALISGVTTEEIKSALFDIDDDKAPGPDGFGSFFFKSSWDIIAPDIIAAVQEFFANGQLLKQWNHTILALIPKSADANEVQAYRPISCCTVFYKVISKILVNRLRQVIGGLVDGAQTGFIQGRSIVDNIHLAQELLRKYARKKISARCLLKVDIQKAYDSVHWDYLRDILHALNFPSRFVQWIMECVSTTSYSISINGQLHGMFHGRRGLRQGDPLSPFLFTLCLEMLSRSLKRMARSLDFGFHPKCCNLRITHLAYADDLLLFSRGDTRSVAMLMKCLNSFGDMAGLRINLLKSNIYMAGIDDYTRLEILEVTGFSAGSLPFRYLGIPLASKNLKFSDHALLIDAIADKIKAWPRFSLSYAGKLELIRSVLQGVECFWLSILPLPCYVTDAINRLCRQFLWANKHPTIAWKMFCKPKEDGGMGLKNLSAWNKALLAKTLWKIHMKKDTLWIRWVSHVYDYFGNVWDWGWHKDKSPLIKQLLRIRDFLININGSVPGAISCLEGWFGGNHGLSKAYNCFVGSIGNWQWKSLLWKPSIVPKHRFILWLLAHSKLLTRDRQCYVIDKSCVLCNVCQESNAHIFFKCTVSQQIWGEIREWLGMEKKMSSAATALRAFRGTYRGNSALSKMRCTALAACVYHIWCARNRAIFEGETVIMEDIVRKIKILTFRCSPRL